MTTIESVSVPALLRRHWLVLTLVLVYLLRWAQYAARAATYPAASSPGGIGDVLNWLLLGQLYFAGALILLLLVCAGWRRAHWRFYLTLAGVVALPFGLLAVLDN